MVGRPISSQIRQNMIEILNYMKQGYGYEIFKAYADIFPRATMRSIYYHLKKGLEIKEFKIAKVEKEKGNYSWGSETERTYYSLGERARPLGDKKAEEYFKNKAKPAP